MGLYSRLYFIYCFLSGPLEILFTLLIFILSKSLGATPLQLTLIACIKPISSLFSFYVSSAIMDNSHRIKPYLRLNIVVSAIPCLLFPFTDNIWFYIASYAIFRVTLGAVFPAWIEVLKSNTSPLEMSKTISQSSSFYYFLSIIVAPLICFWMDQDQNMWRYLFFGFALLQLVSLTLIGFINTDLKVRVVTPFVNPMKKGWALLKKKPEYMHFMALYFIGGAGIIGTQQILPYYFENELHLSYTQMGLAFSFFKGIAFVVASPYWSKSFSQISIYRINTLMNILTAIYFVLVIAAQMDTNWLYLGYLFYGAMLAGEELSYRLSGPYFSGSGDSALYSSMNLALKGIRGCICPALGSLLFVYAGAVPVLIAALIICCIGVVYGFWTDRRFVVTSAFQKVLCAKV